MGSPERAGQGPLAIRRRLELKTMAPFAGADVSADYFRVMGVPLLRGRSFEAGDTTTAPFVAIINERGAKILWPGADPIGQEILWGAASPGNSYCRIVGVVGNVRHRAAEGEDGIELYYPVTQWPIASSSYVLRTTSDPDTLGDTIRRTIKRRPNPRRRSPKSRPWNRIDESLWQQRLWGGMFGAFAALA